MRTVMFSALQRTGKSDTFLHGQTGLYGIFYAVIFGSIFHSWVSHHHHNQSLILWPLLLFFFSFFLTLRLITLLPIQRLDVSGLQLSMLPVISHLWLPSQSQRKCCLQGTWRRQFHKAAHAVVTTSKEYAPPVQEALTVWLNIAISSPEMTKRVV